MSLCTVSDAFLAARAAAGDQVAFAELARRYRPLLGRLTAGPPAGVEVEDLRQEALIGLFDTCRRHDPARGPFAALAQRNVRWRVGAARASARTVKHRLLTHAARDGDDSTRWLAERLPAPAGSDPARVVELRDELRERAERAQQPACRSSVDRRRRYSDEQTARALALIADGNTIKQAAFAVGAPSHRVGSWVKRAGQPRPAGRRRFTPQEIRQAVALVHSGASLRQAGAAVGTTGPTVLRWLRQAA